MKNLNKLIIFAFTGSLLMTFMACNNSDAASFQEIDLKKNEQLKEKVFEQILNDEELFRDFTMKMRENGQSMQWMRENRPMMQDFYGSRQMQDMMRWNPDIRHNMLQNMMQMMERDTAFMSRNPEMSQQMMQNLLKMMERDPNRINPAMRQQLLEHMRKMMEQDTVLQTQMQQMMEGNHMMRNN